MPALVRTAALAAAVLLAACGERSEAQKADAAAAAPSLRARMLGDSAAPVTVYEMSDFQCPYCRMHALATFPELERDFVRTGKVRWVFINFPLVEIHPNAVPAAELALCAGRQGKFWEVHDLLFRNQTRWAKLADPGQYFMTFADSAGLARDTLLACVQSGATRAEVESDARGSVQAGAQSTPTFYIEGGLLVGAQPPEVFRAVLDSIHAARTARR